NIEIKAKLQPWLWSLPTKYFASEQSQRSKNSASALVPLMQETQNDSGNSYCTFLRHHDEFEGADLSDIVDESPMQMRKETPLELVAATFQRMASTDCFLPTEGLLSLIESPLHFIYISWPI
ncbi:14595_t:CDS:2, partial [Acaulospora colombiana]